MKRYLKKDVSITIDALEHYAKYLKKVGGCPMTLNNIENKLIPIQKERLIKYKHYKK